VTGLTHAVHRRRSVPRGGLLRDRVLGGLAVLTLVTVLWFQFGPGGKPEYWLEQIGLDLGFVVLCHRVVRSAKDRPLRRFWRAMTLSGICLTGADCYGGLYVWIHPRAEDAGVLQPLLVAAGTGIVVIVMLFHPLAAVGRERLRLWFDAATVMTGVAVFIWYFVVGAHLSTGLSGQASGLAAISVTAVMQLVTAFAILKLLLSGSAPFTRRAGLVGVLVVVGMLVSAALQNNEHADLGRLAQLFPCILFTALPRIQELDTRARQAGASGKPRRFYSRMPYAAVVATQVLLIAGLSTGGLGVRTWGVALGSAGITALVLSRQLIAFHDNARLVRSLDESVKEARALQEQLRHKATHDPLTGLANRALFDERVHVATGEIGILVVDLDDFKLVNDTLGHHVGDGLLVAVAHRLRDCVRHRDTVARLGGDEFAVLLPDTPEHLSRQVAVRMTEALTEPVLVEGHLIALRASIGLATGTCTAADSLLRQADQAMYTNKQLKPAVPHQR
jgi:diguanylate cyclase (GGDEF)-like protein